MYFISTLLGLLLGKYSDFKPKFARRYSDFKSLIVEAGEKYINDVKAGVFTDDTEVFHLSEDEILEINKIEFVNN